VAVAAVASLAGKGRLVAPAVELALAVSGKVKLPEDLVMGRAAHHGSAVILELLLVAKAAYLVFYIAVMGVVFFSGGSAGKGLTDTQNVYAEEKDGRTQYKKLFFKTLHIKTSVMSVAQTILHSGSIVFFSMAREI